MSSLRDLKQSISEMSKEDALSLIMYIRESRRTSKKKLVSKTKKKVTINIDKITPQMALEMIEMLKECK